MMLYSDSFVSQRQNPSWCFAVSTMYFMPAALAMLTHSSALKFVGLNCW